MIGMHNVASTLILLYLIHHGMAQSPTDDNWEKSPTDDNWEKALNMSHHLKVDGSWNTTAAIIPQLIDYPVDIFATVIVWNFLNVSLDNGLTHSYQGLYGRIPSKTSLPKEIGGGVKIAFLALAMGNTRGTSGIAKWNITLPSGDHMVATLIWVVPYTYRLRGAYVGVHLEGLCNAPINLDKAFEKIFNDDTKTVPAGLYSTATHSHGNVTVFAKMIEKQSYQPRIVFWITSSDRNILAFK